MTDLERLADQILRAAGSGLRFYSIPAVREAILEATEEAVEAGRKEARALAAKSREVG